MPNWHCAIDGSTVRLQHSLADAEGPFWSGAVQLHRGAPSFDSHPEIAHALYSIEDPANHKAYVRHRWTYEVPASLDGIPNAGAARRFMVLRSQGEIGWTLVLLMPHQCPRFVYKAVARGFGATPHVLPGKEKKSMAKPTNDNTAKPASMMKGEVPEAKSMPPAAKEGCNTIVSQPEQ